MKYCCKEFEEKATKYEGQGVSLYPPPHPKAQFEQIATGLWAINGCCGGGCFVVGDMRFCPFCGRVLP